MKTFNAPCCCAAAAFGSAALTPPAAARAHVAGRVPRLEPQGADHDARLETYDPIPCLQSRPKRQVLIVAPARHIRPSDGLIRGNNSVIQGFADVVAPNDNEATLMSRRHDAEPTGFEVEGGRAEHS